MSSMTFFICILFLMWLFLTCWRSIKKKEEKDEESLDGQCPGSKTDCWGTTECHSGNCQCKVIDVIPYYIQQCPIFQSLHSACHKKQMQLVLLICRFHQQQINSMQGGDILESSKKQNLNCYALATEFTLKLFSLMFTLH